jgi:hypothetical protein
MVAPGVLRCTRIGLCALRRIAAGLAGLPHGSHDLRIAHLNLHNIPQALAMSENRPRQSAPGYGG